MGLDLVEILICIEEEFEIDFPEDSGAEVETVGDLADHVEREIRKNEIPQWKAEQMYGELLAKAKNELASVLKIPESAIAPNDRLDILVPKNRRREIWNSSAFFRQSAR